MRDLRDRLLNAAGDILVRLLYRVRVWGAENIPARGPALLASNHVSGLDGLLIRRCVPAARVLMSAESASCPAWLERLLRAAGTETAESAQRRLDEGGVVVVFPEGEVTRTGALLPFRWAPAGLPAEAAVIPVYLDLPVGALFGFRGGRLLGRPTGLRRTAVIAFGRSLPGGTSAAELRQAVMELGAEAAGLRHGPRDRLERRFIAAAKRHWSGLALADSSGRELSFGRALTGALLLAGWLRRCRRGERMVGIVLPATAGAALANAAVLLSGKIPVNLNFTAGHEAMQAAVGRCGLKTLLSSRAFLEKAGLAEMPGMVLLEDLLGALTARRRIAAALMARLVPTRWLEGMYGGRGVDEPATVIFSSGSTGEPKGVVLSHRNIASNIDSLLKIFPLEPGDRALGVLPFFHVFGLTCALWFPLSCGVTAIYHPSPTDARAVGELAARYRAALLMATPTFFSHYLRRCRPEEFRWLRWAIAGGEKLAPALARAFREKFGLELLEGYGATEMSPVVAVNAPDAPGGQETQRGHKPGTVGRPIPGVAVRVVDPASGEPLPAGCQGLLLVKGPNRMVGYLDEPERTARALREGWYVTGDIASLDEEGFLTIADRLARFSKIGGEMVPHVRVEQTLSELLEGAPCAVMAVPDPERGERLVALYTRREVSPAELWRRLNQTSLPKLWIPKCENLYWVEELPPPLASGKLDLRRLRALAREMAGLRPDAAAGC
jgi:acyl-[acyl-carrier-protein]-phospholipid O-acyltransferase/long-chain-fatty-acid--[acyl-carrier-protein] ligase